MIDLILGDCGKKLKDLADNSVDSIVTDPPAGIGFMGKEWDHDKGGRDKWIGWLSGIMAEAMRGLKPGGHALVWALPRTSHWTAMALEDAGFEIRDCIYFCFGTGFPKSLNIGKQVSKINGEEREVVGEKKRGDVQIAKGKGSGYLADPANRNNIKQFGYGTEIITKGTSEFEGWGTGLKPAVECWWLCRKPLSEKTVALNCLKWGTGGLNIDASRIPTNPEVDDKRLGGNGKWQTDKGLVKNVYMGGYVGSPVVSSELGRFPANLIHDGSDEVVGMFPHSTSGEMNCISQGKNYGIYGKYNPTKAINPKSEGSAARFFKECKFIEEGKRLIYTAKASKTERNAGLEGFEEKMSGMSNGAQIHGESYDKGQGIGLNVVKPMQNFHCTVKPISLMRYLCRLITPSGGTVLDPFMGSGSTGCGAVMEGFNFIGIEMEEEYLKIADARIKYWQSTVVEVKKVVNPQLDLF